MKRAIVLVGAFLALVSTTVTAQETASPPATPDAGRTLDQMSTPELLAVAQTMRASGRIGEAQQVTRMVLAREEKNVDAHNLLGELYLAQDPPSAIDAQKAFSIARSLQETDFRANFGLAKIYVTKKVWRQALFHLEIAEKVAPPESIAEVCTTLAEAYRNAGRLREAFAAVERAIATEPKNLSARQMQVALLVDSGVLDRALTENDATLEIAKEKVQTAPNKLTAIRDLYRAYESRVAILQQLGARLYARLPDGKASDRLIVGKEDEITANLLRLTDVFVVMAELRLTLSYFEIIPYAERACLYSPHSAEAWLALARLYRNTSQFDRAARAFDKVLSVDPHNLEAKHELEALGVPPTHPLSEPAESQPAPIP